MCDFTQIDGDYIEGGGQILRLAMSMATILRKNIRITNIRGGRPKPGLRPQHLCAVQLLAEMSGGQLEGAQIGSTTLTYQPGALRTGQYRADIGTAGAVCLVLHPSVEVLQFCKQASSVHISGGTNVDFAPPIDYVTRVFAPTVRKLGVNIDVQILRRGYFPRGGGQITVNVEPITQPICSFDWTERGQIQSVVGEALLVNVRNERIAAEWARHVEQTLLNAGVPQVRISSTRDVSDSNKRKPQISLQLVAETSRGHLIGANILDANESQFKSLPYSLLETVGVIPPQKDCSTSGDDHLCDSVATATAQDAAATNYAVQNGTCVDDNLQDQLIVFMSLAQGRSRLRTRALTDHTRSAIYVAQLVAQVEFQIESIEDSTDVILSCVGLGFFV